MDIKILGTGCRKCRQTEAAVREAVEQSGSDASITKVEDIAEIMKYNILATPAVVIDGNIAIKGRVPSKDEIIKLLTR